MKSLWGSYLLCIFGLLSFFIVSFFGNGGGALVSDLLPEWLSEILGPEVVPLPWPRIETEAGSVAESFIIWTLVFILVVNAPAILQWIVGFMWPLGIVCCPCSDSQGGAFGLASGKSRKKSSSREIKVTSPGAGEEEEVALLMGQTRNDTELCIERKPRITISLRVVTRGDAPEFITEVCENNISAVAEFCDASRQKRISKSRGRLSRDEKMNSDDGDEEDVDEGPNWILEVVTERPLDLEKRLGDNGRRLRVFEILVPRDYKAPNDTHSKARNLFFANTPGTSCLTNDDFIVHLDEETMVTQSILGGIVEFVEKYPDRIGQGMTVFGQGKSIGNWILTMCDTTRCIDDYCCFRFWHTMGMALRGMKGSNFVLRVGIERYVSWDLGASCSLLEDAAFALTAGQKGVKFGHVQGIMLEQSPLTYADYFRQRRRWLNGLMKVCAASSIGLRYRWLLIISLISWLCAPLSLIAFLTLVCFFHIPALPNTVFTRVLITAPPAWGAVWGAYLSFSAASRGFFLYSLLIITNLLIIPLLSFLEASAVIFAVCVPTKTFQVVKKHLTSSAIQECVAFDQGISSSSSPSSASPPHNFAVK